MSSGFQFQGKESRRDSGSPQEFATQVLGMIVADIECIQDQNGDPYLRVKETGRVRTIEGTLPGIRSWLSNRFMEVAAGQHPPPKLIGTMVDSLIARCMASSKSKVDYRVTMVEDYYGLPAIFYDQGTDDWASIVVTPDHVGRDHPPFMPFRRSEGMKDLPPLVDEDADHRDVMELLQDVAPLPDRDHEILRLGFLLASLWPEGPYPILSLVGPPECGKGYHTKIIRDLVDPVGAPFQGFPYQEVDLMLDAYNERILVLDNVTTIPPYANNALCRISTGGSMKKKRLYMDKTRVAVYVANPIVITSTDRVLNTPDLVSRSILLELPPISDEGRWDESKALRRFQELRPIIFRKLLSLIQCALGFTGRVKKQSRITPMFRVMTAAEEHLGWTKGTFERAYYRNRTLGHDSILSEYPYIAAIRDLIQEKLDAAANSSSSRTPTYWEGTYKELLNEFRERIPAHLRGVSWPSTERLLQSQLKQIETSLEDMGYLITWNIRKTRVGQRLRLEKERRSKR